MSKVFVTYIPDDLEEYTTYNSLDYHLPGRRFRFPVSNMLATRLEEDDEVKVVCCFPINSKEDEEVEEIYEALQAEISEIISQKNNCSAEFVAIDLQCLEESGKEPGFATDSVMSGFGNIVKEIKQGDTVYTDLSYGLKVYAVMMFVAAYYTVTTTKDVTNGGIFSAIDVAPGVKDIVKVDSLALSASLAGEMGEGSRAMLDKLIGISAASVLEASQAKNLEAFESKEKEISEDADQD